MDCLLRHAYLISNSVQMCHTRFVQHLTDPRTTVSPPIKKMVNLFRVVSKLCLEEYCVAERGRNLLQFFVFSEYRITTSFTPITLLDNADDTLRQP